MFNKSVALALVTVMTALSIATAAQSEANGQAEGQQGKSALMKAKVQKMGVGERSVVRVKLKDGTQIRGSVAEIGNDSFTVADKMSNKTTSVNYGDVQTLKGKGLSTTAKVLIGVGIGVGILATVVAVALSHGVGVKI